MRHWVSFRGRTSRAEYGRIYAALLVVLVCLKLATLAPRAEVIAPVLAGLALFPLLAASVRRLHDTGRSGTTLLFCLIPIVGTVIFISWILEPGTPASNRFGPPPGGTDKTREQPLRRRPHLDAAGTLIAYDYVDQDGNVLFSTEPTGTLDGRPS